MATSLNASLNVKLNPTSLAASSKQIQHALGRITGQASEFQKSLDASTARVFAFGATTAVINTVSQSFKKLVTVTIEVEKRLIEINSIFQATEATFNKFRNSIFKVAKETGQSFSTVADGAAELARQGLSAEETAKRLKAALVLTRISGLDSAKSVKALTAAINGFASAGLNANQIVNKMVAVDTAFAVSTQDLAEAFSRAGSTAEDAGVSFNELLGLVTAVEQRTARGGAVIGNAFKSIFTRMSRGSTIEKLKELGVEIDSTQTGIQKLNALSVALQNISDPTIASQIKELAGGVFQINVVSAALKDLSSDTSIFAKAAATASQATNEAFEKNAELSKSISSQINVLIQGLTSLSERIGTITFGPLLENLLGLTTKFTEFLDKALDPEKGNVFIKGLFKAIGSFLSGPAVVIFTVAFVKIFKLVAKFAGEGLRSLFAVGSQTERIRSIEGGVVGLLQRDDVLRKTILNSTVSQAQKEQAVISAIQRENRELEQQAALMRKIASAAAARGVTGFNPNNGSFKGRRGKRYATGFMEEEATARALGASSNVQAHFGKGTIGGSRFVMNDNEVEIPNFAGGNSAVIPMYAGGNMPSYAKAGRALSASPDKIGKMSQSALNQFTGTKIYKNSNDLNAKNAVAARQKQLKKDNTEDVVQINPQSPPTAMLIPNIGARESIPMGTRGRFNFKGKKMGFEYAKGLAVEGPKVPRAVDQAADPHDEKLKKNITRSVTTNAANFSGLLQPVLGKPSPAKILQKLKRQGGGKGALKGIVGAAFEASVNAALDISPARKVDGGDFDVKNVEGGKGKAIRGLFGVKNEATKIFDYKQAKGGGSAASFAKKIANEDKAKGRFKTESRPKRRSRNYAGGYMPKFAEGASKGTSKGFTGRLGGGGMLGLFFGLQGILGAVSSKYGQNSDAIDKETEEKIKLIEASGKQYAEIKKLTKAIKEQAKATKEAKPATVSVSEGIGHAMSAAMTLGSLSSLVGKGGMGNIKKVLTGSTANLKPKGHAELLKAKQDIAFKKNRKGFKMPAKDALDDAKIKAAASTKAGGGMMRGASAVGKIAGALAVVVGAVSLIKTASDDTLEDKQKKERYKSTGGAMTGSVIGAAVFGALGSIVPVLGTAVGVAVGGAIGGWVGSSLGDAEGADQEVMDRLTDSRDTVINSTAGSLRNTRASKEDGGELLNDGLFKNYNSFQDAVNKNLNKVAAGEGGIEAADALKANYDRAVAVMADIVDRKKTGPVSNEEEEDANAQLTKASLKLAGRRFLTEEREEQHFKQLTSVNNRLTKTTDRLTAAREALALREGRSEAAVKKDQIKGNIRNSLASSISGPFAGAVGLASEQNMMFRDINAAKLEQSQANSKLKSAEKDPSSTPEKITELQKAATAAGDSFSKAVTGAAVSFKNKIVSLEKGIENIKKQRTQLEDKQNKASEAFMLDIATGKTTGSASGLIDSIKEAEDYEKHMGAKRRGAKGSGYRYQMTAEESAEGARLMKNIDDNAVAMGFEEGTAFKTVDQTLYKKFTEGPNVGRSAREEASSREARTAIDKFGGEGTYKELHDQKTSEEEGITKLNEQLGDLGQQLEQANGNWKKLQNDADTARLAANVNSLAAEMETAAGSVHELTLFSKKITTTVADTSGLITTNALFVEEQKDLMKLLAKQIEWLTKRISGLSKEGDDN